MRVLVACEASGVVRDAFRALGHDAWSCDLIPAYKGSQEFHIVGDALEVAYSGEWDLMVAHPPCTHLSVSGAMHFPEKRADGRQQLALEFVRRLMDAPIHRIAIENPVSVISSFVRPPDMSFQPYQFGHGETKRTCLWLKNLPKLEPTLEVEGREPRVHWLPPSKDRARLRAETLPGVASAMAEQWGNPDGPLFAYAERTA